MHNVQGLMAGKRGVVMGVANDRSIAWGIASALSDAGASLAFTYQDDAFVKRVQPLADSVGADFVVKCDVEDDDEIQRTVDAVAERWGTLDFIIHAIAYSDKAGLKGAYLNTTKDNFTRTLQISCYSFTAVARAARSLMADGGSLVTLTYLGAERVTPNYNVMGVAKAALEASVRYLANDLGPQGIRVNAISAGPVRTLAGSAIADARFVYRWTAEQAPMERNATLEEIGSAGLYLVSDLSRGVTGEIHHVDCGFHAIAIPSPDRINERKPAPEEAPEKVAER